MTIKFVLATLLMLPGAVAVADQAALRAPLQPVNERKPAPEFGLIDASGKTATLADYRGKVVLLDFWATWCTGCKQEIPWFVEFQKSYDAAGLSVVGVSLDEGGWKVLKPFLAEHTIPYRIVLGDDAMAKRYSIEGMPDTFLIDREGRVAATYRAGLVDRNDVEANIKTLLAEHSTARAASQVVSRELRSKNFANNKIGISPVRKMLVYLPPGYEESSKPYPVIYFLSNAADGYRSAFDQKGAQGLFDEATAAGVIGKFIPVSVDMNTPLGAPWYVNSPVTGNWEDCMIDEVVPYAAGTSEHLRTAIPAAFLATALEAQRSESGPRLFQSSLYPQTGRIWHAHEAEEYRGAWGERNWGEDGRIYMDALPFFRKHLAVAQ